MPIDQEQVATALIKDTKLSKPLYESLGMNVTELKKQINGEISRGISSAMTYQDMARNIRNQSNVSLNKSIRIARTEAHRVNQQATYDAMEKAKDSGADVVKQWDSTLDRKTRPHHAQLDGQIRELDEPFEIDGLKAMCPGGFGKASEDINCRCVLLQRARWALDDEELQTLKDRAAYFGMNKAKDFDDFKKKYMRIEDTLAPRTASAKILDDLQKYADNNKGKSNSQLNDIAQKLGVSTDEAKARITEGLKDITQNCDVGMRIKVNNLEKVLQDTDGGFKNLYEVGTGGGCLDTNVRNGGERKVFNYKGTPSGKAAQDRPVYGMMIPKLENGGSFKEIDYINYGPGAHYGDGVTCVIKKDKIFNNASFTLGDSLDNQLYVYGSTFDNPQFNGAFYFFKEKAVSLVDTTQKANKKLVDTFMPNYLEVQIHGKENHSADIIEKVYFTDAAFSDAKSKGIIDTLGKKGIPYEILKG